MTGNNHASINYKAIFLGGFLSILIFAVFYYTEVWSTKISGTEMTNSWLVSETEHTDPFNSDNVWKVQEIPFHSNTPDSLFINCKYNFDGNYEYLVLPFLSSSGFRIYLNGVLINQTGDVKNGTANVWNHVHLIALDQNLLHPKANEILIELYSMYTHGIDKSPILSNADDVYIKVYLQNLFRTYIPFISMGAAMILGIILIVLGISDKSTRKLFFNLGFCMLLTMIFLYDDRFRISSGSVEQFLMLRKISVSAGFLASWFLTAAMEIYTTDETRVSKILLIANVLIVFFGILQPTFAAYTYWVTLSIIVNIINILTATVILLTHIKSKEWLFLPIFFMNLTFIHYIVTWHILRVIGPNLVELGLIFGSIGFGLILIVQFKELLKKNIKMEKKTLTLEIQKDEALNIAQTKSDIIAQTSHEIRNPLMGILGMSESLLSKNLDEDTKDDISVIKSCALNLKEILNNILDNAKIEAGKFELYEERFSIKDVVHELDSIYSVLTRQKNLEWSVIIEKNVPEYVVTDKVRITQLLNNLLSNAVKYTNTGKVALIISENKNMLVFAINDTGTGIKKELQDKIFDPYYQLENSNQIQGTGLGLSIVKKLLTVFDGKLELTSVPDEGSSFVVSIPYKQAVSKEKSHSFKASGQQNILLADDNRINLRVLKQYLNDLSNVTLSVVDNGKDALKTLSEESFDFIVLDINMPFFNGDEIVTNIKRSESKNKDACFIALTGENKPGTTIYLKQIGFDFVLKKPVSKQYFLNLFSTNSENEEKKHIQNALVEKIKNTNLDKDTTYLIINEFLKETPDHLKVLSEAVKNKNFKSIYTQTHYFKSSLDYLGTEKATNLRKLLEDAAKDEESNSIDLHFKDFSKEIEESIKIFTEMLENQNIS